MDLTFTLVEMWREKYKKKEDGEVGVNTLKGI